jgi:two-component system NtrC family response regulator
MIKILFVDDEWESAEWDETFAPLQHHNIEVVYEADGGKTTQILREQPDIKLLLLDLQFPWQSRQGEDILREVKGGFPELPVIIFTVVEEVEKAIDCMEKGAHFYFVKSEYLDLQQLAFQIMMVVKQADLLQENRLLREENAFGDMVGKSSAFNEVKRVITQVAETDATVLITGETGTGKELAARAIHQLSKRKDKLFVPINCAAIPKELIESELFGHERGAFTDATRRKEGKFKVADKGTIFLDEIGDMSQEMQVKLLRVLQEREFEMVGGTETIEVDVRVIAATNKDLHAEVEAGNFRQDLFYRINVVLIELPSLRERKKDIPLFVNTFIHKFNRKHNRSISGIIDDALKLLTVYNWPGNIRELENLIERALVLRSPDDTRDLQRSDFPGLSKVTPSLPAHQPDISLKNEISVVWTPDGGKTLSDIEQEIIQQALLYTDKNQTRAANLIGMPYATFRRRLENC